MKTAVEWLVNEFFTKNGMQVTKESNPALFEVVEQAKAMEKEQKCIFANEYAHNVMAGMMKTAEDFLQEYELKTE
jgi:hypothetical protein